MSETLCITKRTIAIVSCVWFGAGAKDAKSLLEQTIGFVRREEIVALANHVTVTIEAAGSGKVLLPQLQVRLNTPIRELKEKIIRKLSDTNNHLNTWKDVRLFQGHGGPEVVESIVGDTMLVLVASYAKLGTFWSRDRNTQIRKVWVTSDYLMTLTHKSTSAWDIRTGRFMWNSWKFYPYEVGDTFFMTRAPIEYAQDPFHMTKRSWDDGKPISAFYILYSENAYLYKVPASKCKITATLINDNRNVLVTRMIPD